MATRSCRPSACSRSFSVADLRSIVDQLVEQELLAVDGERYPVLTIPAAGWDLLRGRRDCTLLRVPPPPPGSRSRRRATTGAPAGLDAAAAVRFERLRALRRSSPPSAACRRTSSSTTRPCVELARLCPSSLAALHEVRGIGERKVADYGERLFETLAVETGV